MLLIIILLLFTFILTNAVSEEVNLQTQNVKTLELDVFNSHLEFFTSMTQILENKVQAATESLLQYSKIESDQLLTNMDADHYLFLQLLHSLSSDDLTFTNQLLEKVAASPSFQKPFLSEFVRSNIDLPSETMYRVTEAIVTGKEKRFFQIPDSIVKEVILMLNKSEVFLEACKRGDNAIVQWLIDTGIDFDLTKPLEAAWKNGRLDVVKVLIRNGALNPKIEEQFKDTANATLLHLVSSGSSYGVIKALLKAGAPINGVDESGASPLFLAVINNDLASAKIFIENGADITVKDNSGNTPLHFAALNGNLKAVRLLLSRDASIHERNNLGLTPLHISDQSGIFYILKYLLRKNIRLPNVIVSDQTVSPYTFFLSEYGKLIHENDTDKIENYCEITQLMNGRAARVPFDKEFKNNLLELVIKNKIFFLAQCLINLGGELSITNRNNETLLINAVRVGSYDIVRLLSNEGVDVNAKNVNGTSAIHLASANGMLDIVGLLLKRGANIDAVNKAGYTALHFAAKEGHIDMVDFLIGKKISLNTTTNSYDQRVQETPLHLAAANAHLDIVKNFLKRRIFDDSKKNETWNTIHVASKAGHVDIVNFLLDYGYDVSIADKDDQTALWWASYGGSVSTVMALLERGADVQTRSKSKSEGYRFRTMLKSMETPLHIAAKNGHKEICDILMKKGINKDVKDAVGETPLYNAARHGHFFVVKFLVERKANKNVRAMYGTTALHAAAIGGHVDIIEYLFDKGMDIEVQSTGLMTPLHVASEAGRLSSVRQLIGLLADVNAATSNLETPLTLAVRNGHYDVAELLIDNGANIDIVDTDGNTLLMDAVYRSYRDIAKLLLRRGPKKLLGSKRHRDEKTAMHLAAAKGPMMIELLLQYEAACDEADDTGFTPLYIAVVEPNEASVKYILEKCADVKLNASRKGDGWTCLHISALFGYTNTLKLLLDKSVNEIDLKTRDNDTALHKAVSCSHYDTVRLLLDKGADVNIKNSEGQTVFDIALKNNNTDILKLRLCDCKASQS